MIISNRRRVGLWTGISAIALLCVSVTDAWSAGVEIKREGVVFPGRVKIAGEELQLNGVGIRRATFLKVKAYAAGLYLREPSRDAKAILDSPAPKFVVMTFLRDVSRSKIADAWETSFEKNCEGADCKRLIERVRQLGREVSDVKKGDRMSFLIQPARLEIKLNDVPVQTIDDAAFSRTMLSTWIGKHPPNEDLREDMLGAATK